MLPLWSSALASAVLLVVLTAQTSHAASKWNQAARDLVVEIQNDLRRKEGGCHINKLEYDQELENQARSWAERCVFKHELKEGRGENLAYSTMPQSESELIKDSVQRWFDEKNRYSYGQHSCGDSNACHYSQIVWGTTNKVGCYSTTCGYLTGATQNAWYLVCFYTPKGNWIGEKPYEKGCSSLCLEGQTVEDGLCVGEPVQGKNQGPDEGDCDDDVGACAVWARQGECENNPDYMKDHCQKSCKLCQSQGECEDTHYNCAEWASYGECQSNPEYMNHNCKKACGAC